MKYPKENNSICILVCIESLTKDKGLSYHDMWLAWSDLFCAINTPVYILTTNTPDENQSIQTRFHSSMHYYSDKELAIFKILACYKEKQVFSKKHSIVYPYSFILYQNKIHKTYKRMNHKQISQLFLDVLELKYILFVKQFKQKITQNLSNPE